MLYVALNNIELHGFHGMYAEEKVLGNTFIINIKVGVENENTFIDYCILKDEIVKRFSIPTEFLETLVLDIEKAILKQFEKIDYLFLSIQKKNPPLGISTKSSEVVLEKKY